MLQDAATIGVLFFLGFVGLGLAILTVLRFWLVDDVLESGIAIGIICAILIGSGWILKTSSPLLMLLWTILLIGGSLVWPTLSALSDKNALRQIHADNIEKYKNIIAHDASNAAAWRELGEVYFKLNAYDEAIAAYKEAIKLNPRDVQEIRRRLNRALEYKAELPSQKQVVCKYCHQETPAGRACTHCGEILDTSFYEWFIQPRATSEVLPTTLAILAGTTAVFVMFAPLSLSTKAVIVTFCLGIGAFLLWHAARDTD